ncbi:MAG: LytR C-terminal domain-containing protein [Aeromicrobium sp.]
MVDHRKTPRTRAYRLPGWFFIVAGVLSLLGLAVAGWVLVADPFGGAPSATTPTAPPTSAAPKSPTPTPVETTSTSDEASDSDRAKPGGRDGIKVVVLNATSKPGLAAQFADMAEKAGWAVETGNWPYPAAQNAVFYPEGHQAEAELLGDDLAIKSVRPIRPGMNVDQLTVIVLTAP